MLLSASSVLAQNLTVNGSLDVLAGPITLGTGQIWDGTGTWDPYNPTLIGADGLTIQFQDTGAWDWGAAGMDIYATFYDPDGSPYSGDEYWGWNDQWGNYQETNSTSIIDHWGNSVDGYTQNPVIVYHEDSTQSSYNLGTGEITFLSAKPDTTFRWQVSQPDGNGSFYPQDVMTLDSTGSLSIGSLHASDVVSSYVSTYYLYAYSGFNSYGNIYSAGTQNTMPSQTLGGGNSSVMTLGLSDARYLRRDSSVSVSGSYAGGIGQNLLSGGTQFVSGKNNVSDTTALFIVGAGSSTSSRKNALSVSSAGNTTVDGTLTVTGATTLSGTLGVTGAATLSNSLTVGGATTVQALSAASGSFSGNASVGGNFTVTGTLTVGGQTPLNATTGDARYLRGDLGALRYGPGGSAQDAYSMAIGVDSRARGDQSTSMPSFAFGKNAAAGLSWAETGFTDISIENSGAWGGGAGGFAVGEQAFAGYQSIAFGPKAKARYAGIAFGEGAQAYGTGGFAVGYYSKAGDNAVSIGNQAGHNGGITSGASSLSLGTASHGFGERAISMGAYNWAHAQDSISMGYGGQALTINSVAIGRGSVADRWGQVVLGVFNQPASSYSNTPLPDDLIFVVGNGADDSNRSNAFVIKRNGDTEVVGTLKVGGHEVLTTEDGAGYALQTALAAVSDTLTTVNTAVTDLSSSVSSGYVAKSSDTLAIGTNAIASAGGFAWGYQSIAGENAISIGGWAGSNGYPTSGPNSISLGGTTHGYGAGSISIGSAFNWAVGADSISIGAATTTNSDSSVAVGKNVISYHWGQVVLGTFNIAPSASNTLQSTDDIFVIGNGTADNARSNAFVIKRNGDTQVKGGLVVEGELVPATTDKVIPKEGQMILVPEQGDISMGEFRAGALPVAQ